MLLCQECLSMENVFCRISPDASLDAGDTVSLYPQGIFCGGRG